MFGILNAGNQSLLGLFILDIASVQWSDSMFYVAIEKYY